MAEVIIAPHDFIRLQSKLAPLGTEHVVCLLARGLKHSFIAREVPDLMIISMPFYHDTCPFLGLDELPGPTRRLVGN